MPAMLVRRGSITYRVLQHLRSLPPGAEVDSETLQDVVQHHGCKLSPVLSIARRKLVLTGRRVGKLVHWSLGPNAGQVVHPRPRDAAVGVAKPQPHKAAPLSSVWQMAEHAGGRRS